MNPKASQKAPPKDDLKTPRASNAHKRAILDIPRIFHGARIFHGCFTGEELVDFLREHHAVTAGRRGRARRGRGLFCGAIAAARADSLRG